MSNNKKVIWIVNQYATLPSAFGGTRHYDIAQALINKNLEFFIISSGYSNFEKKEKQNYGSSFYKIQKVTGNTNFVWLKTPGYNSNGLKRNINTVVFSRQLKRVSPYLKAPDLIIGSSPQLICSYQGLKLAKKFKIPFIFEVRDIWPQSLIELGMSRFSPLVTYFKYLEKKLMYASNHIVSIMPFFKEYATGNFNIDNKKITWISNGVADRYISHINKRTQKKKYFDITYSGTIGVAQNSECIIGAANLLRNYKNIRFNMIGEGVEKKAIIQKVRELDLENNVLFFDPLPKDKIFNKLYCSDVLVSSLKYSSIYKYGTGPNKIFDYMAAGRPIIFASSSKNSLVEEAKCGIMIKSDNSKKLAEELLKLYRSGRSKLEKMGRNGRLYVRKYYAISNLAKKYYQVIIELLDK